MHSLDIHRLIFQPSYPPNVLNMRKNEVKINHILTRGSPVDHHNITRHGQYCFGLIWWTH